MAFRRAVVPHFELANGAYRNAVVTFYKVDTTTNERTSQLATIYDQAAGGDQLANPYTLDGQGRAQNHIYIEEPVIAVIGQSTIASHDTGIIYPLGGDYIGVWETDTTYFPGDIVKDGANGASTNNLYISTVEHVSGTWLTDLGAAKWELVIDVAEVAGYAAAASDDADAAAASASAAAASASSASDDADSTAADVVTIQALVGNIPTIQALEYLRGNAAGDALEYRSASEVLSDIGAAAAIHTHTLSQITDAGTMAAQNASSVAITGGTASGLTITTGNLGAAVKQRSYTTRLFYPNTVTALDDKHCITFRRPTRLYNIDASTTTGTVDVDLKKNGTNIGGINGVTVSSTQTETAVDDSSNAYIDFAAEDKLSIDRYNVSGAENLEIFLDLEDQ